MDSYETSSSGSVIDMLNKLQFEFQEELNTLSREEANRVNNGFYSLGNLYLRFPCCN